MIRYRKSALRTALVHAANGLIAQATELDLLRRCAAADSRVQIVPPCDCQPWGRIAIGVSLGAILGGGVVWALVGMVGSLA
jgi:hypothetical protein